MDEKAPLPLRFALPALARCGVRCAVLLGQRRVRLPRDRIGMRMRFSDGTSAQVYRETVVVGAIPARSCVLEVEFRLRGVRGWGHPVFRWESLLNTPLFVGFPGFVSKLWLAHDEVSRYRGLYEWDGPERAEAYARALWWVLALVSARGSIHYQVVPGLHRDEFLARAEQTAAAGEPSWWQLAGVG
jgi:hypothetical protein